MSRSVAAIVAVFVCTAGCTAPGGTRQRATVLAATCDSFLARRDIEADPADAELFERAFAEQLASGRPFSPRTALESVCNSIAVRAGSGD
jgi:hypothetical protein